MALSENEVKRINVSMPVANDLKIGDLLKQLEDSTGGEVTVTWADIQSKPTLFNPSAHTHEIAEVNGLQAELDSIKSRLDALEGGGA